MSFETANWAPFPSRYLDQSGCPDDRVAEYMSFGLSEHSHMVQMPTEQFQAPMQAWGAHYAYRILLYFTFLYDTVSISLGCASLCVFVWRTVSISLSVYQSLYDSFAFAFFVDAFFHSLFCVFPLTPLLDPGMAADLAHVNMVAPELFNPTEVRTIVLVVLMMLGDQSIAFTSGGN